MGIFVFRGVRYFFRFTLKAFISIRMTLGTIQNDYFQCLTVFGFGGETETESQKPKTVETETES